MHRTKADTIAQLQKDILLLQGFKPLPNDAANANTPLNIIRNAFPNNTFPLAAVHDFFCSCAEDSAASCGFIAGILSAIMKGNGLSVWICASKNIFPPALKLFGIEPQNVIFIESQQPKKILWAIEEALKCDGLSAVVGEINDISFIESRRLQLAVEQSGVTGFLVRNNPKNLATSCVTRWKIKPLQSENENGLPGVGFPRWNVELLKVRNGKTGNWQMEWRNGRFKLISKQSVMIKEGQRKIG